MNDIEYDSFLPLAPSNLQILLALSGDELHGYGIMQEVRRQTGERYNLGPATLYGTLQKLTEQGLVHETSPPKGVDARRKYYRLTTDGQAVLAAEITRLEGIVREARQRKRRADAQTA